MNFCPNCGAKVQDEQSYCGSCGYDLLTRAALAPSDHIAEAPLSPRGLGWNSEYIVTPEGILKVRIRSDLFVIPVVLLALPFAILLGVTIQAVSPWFFVMAWFLIAVPLFDEFKWRKLEEMGVLSPDELAALLGSLAIPWSSIRSARLRGRMLWISSIGPRLRGSMAFDEKEVPALERTLSSRLGERFQRLAPRRATALRSNLPALVLGVFIVCQLLLVMAAVLPFFPGEESYYASILNSVKQSVTYAPVVQQYRLILLNNVQVALGSGVPGFGLFPLLLADYNTGRIIQVIAIQANVPASLEIVNLFLYPHTWVEELSYAVAAGASLYYLFNWNATSIGEMPDRLKRSSVRLSLSFVCVAVMLSIAALLEVAEPHLGGGALLLWVPLGLGVILSRQRLVEILNRLSGR